MDSPAQLDQRVLLELLDQLVVRVILEAPEHLELQGHQEPMVQLERQEPLGLKDLLEHQEILDHQERQVVQVKLELVEPLEHLEAQDHQVVWVLRVLEDRMEQ